MKSTLVSTLQHVYTVYVPTEIYALECSKAQKDPSYKTSQAPSYDTVCIQPGISSLPTQDVERLKHTRVFAGLLASGAVKVNDISAEDMYQTKLNPHFRNTKEYQAAKKQADLEAANARLHAECADLKQNMSVLQAQMAELLSSVKTKKESRPSKKEGVTDDNSGDNKDTIS